MLTVLSLFAGIGGLDLGLERAGRAGRRRRPRPGRPPRRGGQSGRALVGPLLAAQWAAADLITAGTADPWPPKPGEVWQDMHDGRWTPIPGRPGELMKITGVPHPSGLPVRGPADEVARRYGPMARLLAAWQGAQPETGPDQADAGTVP